MTAKEYLFSGIILSSELETIFNSTRRFITVSSYIEYKNKSFLIPEFRKKYLTTISEENVKYYFHIYTISDYFISDNLDIHENDCMEYYYHGEINNFEDLVESIKKVIPNFNINALVPIWKTDAPM